MKSTIISFTAVIGLLLYSCQAVEQQNKTTHQVSNLDNVTNVVKKTLSNSEELNKNAVMIKSDCYSCHTNDTKLIGPSFNDIAKKYTDTDGNIKLLVDKVINGGSGVWGEVPMQSHSQMSDTEAKEMINYILALK